jgi:hypothetical protein
MKEERNDVTEFIGIPPGKTPPEDKEGVVRVIFDFYFKDNEPGVPFIAGPPKLPPRIG